MKEDCNYVEVNKIDSHTFEVHHPSMGYECAYLSRRDAKLLVKKLSKLLEKK